ncbi:PP2C family protein-serine/threonine phosphatase [Sphaerimonospora mesophila]|uniref:PP2C family protein-serine/threonine phosphatase n=1 Tax=Sphaerimonospora mesophila TaxID=37483 RepID=UPI0006E26C61
MPAHGCDNERILGDLVRAHHLTPLKDLARVVGERLRSAGLTEVMIYVADLQGRLLIPLPGQRDASGEPLKRVPIDTTLAGRAYRNVEIVQVRPAAGPNGGANSGPDGDSDTDPDVAEVAEPVGSGSARRLWAPLLDGTERVGVFGVTVPRVDETTKRRVAELSALIALMVMSKRDPSDAYARLARTEDMHLSAEVLWTLMPIRTFATETLTVSAALEPAYSVGGDAFDYGLDYDTLHLAVFDAMGHDTSAGLTATIALGSYRNNRRRDIGLLAVSDAIDEAISEQFAGSRFATGILADLDLPTGWLTWVNRGHPPPLVLRHGRVAAVLDSSPDLPMGFALSPARRLPRYQLEPGDRLLFYTDGITEAETPEGERFGLERFTNFIIKREADGISAPETVRRLIHAILRHQRGRLQDDATVLLVEWRSGRQFDLSM